MVALSFAGLSRLSAGSMDPASPSSLEQELELRQCLEPFYLFRAPFASEPGLKRSVEALHRT